MMTSKQAYMARLTTGSSRGTARATNKTLRTLEPPTGWARSSQGEWTRRQHGQVRTQSSSSGIAGLDKASSKNSTPDVASMSTQQILQELMGAGGLSKEGVSVLLADPTAEIEEIYVQRQ